MKTEIWGEANIKINNENINVGYGFKLYQNDYSGGKLNAYFIDCAPHATRENGMNLFYSHLTFGKIPMAKNLKGTAEFSFKTSPKYTDKIWDRFHR